MGVLVVQPLLGQDPVRGRVANPHGGLKIPCENCHTTTSWRPIRTQPEFDHDTQTKYPLRGMHQGVACRNCHVSLVFSNTGTRCADCHADVHRRQFGANCQNCHTVRGWNEAVSAFQQHSNRFPLIGAHAVVTCDACHRGAAVGTYTGLSTACVSCHLKDYQTAGSLNHIAAKLPTSCESCHGMDRWRGARFDHASLTQFPLTGAHAQLECKVCHVAGRFQGTPANCFGCHVDDFNRTRNPGHAAAGFPHDCSVCHSTSSWTGATFDHAARTRFALTGAHASAGCAQCHIGGRFAGTPTQCSGCHLADFEKTNNPDHRKAHFATACESCHTVATWQNAKFDHNLSGFPLTGAHTAVACAQCHAGGQFTSTPKQCAGCHLTDFQKTTNPNHVTGSFSQDCASCHTTAQWKGAKFDHNLSRFHLTGAHVTVECARCHVNGKFAGTPTQCSSCHLTDFQKATNPNHVTAGFPQDCTVCHTTSQWKGAKFDHAKTRFALSGAHSTVECAQCHVNGKFTGTPTQCSSCHLTDFQKTTNPNHVTAGFPQDCTVCHTTSQWRGAKFDHAKTRFALTGAHSTVECAQCHVNGKFTGTPTQCSSCHLTDFQKTTNPNHVTAGFPQDCTVCHTTSQWKGAKFDHAKTRFVLTGAHSTVECAQCHVNGKFTGTPTQCAGCHLTDFQKTTNPNHVAAGFPQDCTVCHTTSQWKGAKFDHAKTRFALTGAHSTVECAQCHVNGKFTGTPTQCVSCHLTDFQKTTNPNHVAAGFPQDCTVCHTTSQWKGAKFDHSKTRFTLTGAHTTVECAQCHVNGKFAGTPAQCVSCHLTDFQKTTNPNHVAAGFPQDCTACHTTSQWKGAKFDHAQTRFPLTGAHVTAQCSACHINGVFNGTSAQCSSCHLSDFKKTTNPNHVAAGFPQDCSICHNTTQWQGAKFDHTAATKFPLTGAHTTVACAQCHANNVFSGLSTACSGCHLKDYNGATSPNHKAAGFPQDCSMCHTTSQWQGAKFDHTAATKFPLTGAHTSLQCAQCHTNNVFAGLPAACASCHLNQYNSTTNPNHKAAGFPQDCSMCHSTVNWSGATFNHNSTPFPLTGAHATQACSACHSAGFAGTPTNCDACHLKEYNATTNPNHQAAGFPKDCSVCHNTTSFAGAVFNHAATGFALTGAHSSVACANCHVNGRYAGTPTACYSCHQTEYQTTTNPNHVAAGFPKTCDTCHSTAGWSGATFTHNQFPIYSGTHAGKWSTCNDCHTNPSDYAVFSCINCHAHDKSTTDQHHTEVRNYVYNSANCYACHPQGRGGD